MHFSVVVMAAYFIVQGALVLFTIKLPAEHTLMSAFAIVAGVLLLTGEGHPRARNWAMSLVGAYLALTGLVLLIALSFAGLGSLVALLACAAGVLLFISGPGYQKDKLGFKLLAVYLLAVGLSQLIGLSFSWRPQLLALLAVAAGALILAKK